MMGRILRSPKAVVGIAILAVFLFIAAFGAAIAPYDPSATTGTPLQAPSLQHLLGTTQLGQDVLSELLVGARTSLMVGVVAAAIATILAVIVGISSGYLEDVAGELLSAIANVFLVIPALPLVIVISGYMPRRGPLEVAFVISITGWAWGARVLRAQTLSLRRRDFVLASRAVGETAFAIIIREILPAELPIIAAGFLQTVVFAIITQASLAFLGLVDISQWSWGTMLYWTQNYQAYTLGAWWWYVPPGLCIALTGMALALLNFAIDEMINPRLRGASRGPRDEPRRAPAAPAPAAADRPALAADGVRIVYQRLDRALWAVDGVDLEIPRARIFGIAGESGCGKSTLALAICRLLQGSGRVAEGGIRFSEDGSALVDVLGLEGEALRLFRWEKIALVPQASLNALNPVLTIGAQMRDVAVDHRGSRGWKAEGVARRAEMLRLVGLDPSVAERYPHQLSGGMRQRVMIAMALMLEPRVLIMDEPTTALDVVTQRQLVERLLVLQERLGLTIIFITHDLPLLFEIADWVAVMYAGRVVETARSAQLRAQPLHPYSRGLLNSFPTIDGPESGHCGIPGSPPDLANIPSGCAFRDRCPEVMPRCAELVPPLLPVRRDDGVIVKTACRLYDADPQAVSREALTTASTGRS